jgi:hypothetical protein
MSFAFPAKPHAPVLRCHHTGAGGRIASGATFERNVKHPICPFDISAIFE